MALKVVVSALMLAAIGYVVWRAGRMPAVFGVHIRDGQPDTAWGTVTPAFLDTVQELCRDHGVTTGEIRGCSQTGLIRLWFSAEIPEGFRRQLRNWWTISGWTLKRRSKY